MEKLCRLADLDPKRRAVASSCYAYYDGKTLTTFPLELKGSIAEKPKGEEGFGWNAIFVPAGQDLTLGEMSETQFKDYYLRIKALKQVGDFVRSLQVVSNKIS